MVLLSVSILKQMFFVGNPKLNAMVCSHVQLMSTRICPQDMQVT